MLIYQAPSARFIDDVRGNTISDIMQENYLAHLGRNPAQPEFVSWQNSRSRVRDLLVHAQLNDIHRTLLTQGMMGCYVYSTDKNTEAHFRNLLKS
jgi:hypothetical protein